MGISTWLKTRSADLFYTSFEHYKKAKNGEVGPIAIEVPYWKCGKSLIEDILLFCKLSKKDYLKPHPFANREQLASNIDSNLQLIQFFYIFYTIFI